MRPGTGTRQRAGRRTTFIGTCARDSRSERERQLPSTGEQELSEAALWYERERPRLAAAFVAEIEDCVTAILEQPLAGRLVVADVRRRLVRRFPYALLYRATGEGIRILAVMNLHRRPGYWVGRD